MADAQMMQRAGDALRSILAGSIQTGRWVDAVTGEGLQGNSSATPPDGYSRMIGGRPQFRDMPGATWEPYTAGEQAQWLETVALTARLALREMGQDEVAPPTPRLEHAA